MIKSRSQGIHPGVVAVCGISIVAAIGFLIWALVSKDNYGASRAIRLAPNPYEASCSASGSRKTCNSCENVGYQVHVNKPLLGELYNEGILTENTKLYRAMNPGEEWYDGPYPGSNMIERYGAHPERPQSVSGAIRLQPNPYEASCSASGSRKTCNSCENVGYQVHVNKPLLGELYNEGILTENTKLYRAMNPGEEWYDGPYPGSI